MSFVLHISPISEMMPAFLATNIELQTSECAAEPKIVLFKLLLTSLKTSVSSCILQKSFQVPLAELFHEFYVSELSTTGFYLLPAPSVQLEGERFCSFDLHISIKVL